MHRPSPTKARSARLQLLSWLTAIALLPALACCEPQAGNQEFPRSALQIHGGAGPSWFNIRIADTPAHQELGLMFVSHLPSDEGMLFPQDQPRIVTMWMTFHNSSGK